MKISSVEYKKSLAVQEDTIFIENRKEVVFIGRSNVGKSSLLNALFWKKSMAYVSAMPWKTRTANLFLVNGKYYFTDLPGYGYARGGRESVKKMDELISWYLVWKKAFISTVVMLVDGKIWPQDSDMDMYRFLKEHEIPMLVALTKIDKLSAKDVTQTRMQCEKLLFWEKIIPLSSSKRIGISTLLNAIETMFKL